MDPEKALQDAEHAIYWAMDTTHRFVARQNVRNEARQALEDYQAWRQLGGFEPSRGDLRYRQLTALVKACSIRKGA